MEKVAKKYLRFLEAGDLKGILSLFCSNALVFSPVYGSQLAKEFFTQLFNNTGKSELTLEALYTDPKKNKLALDFHYKWTLKDKSIVQFEVLDIMEFNANGMIQKLTIIYNSTESGQRVRELNNPYNPGTATSAL